MNIKVILEDSENTEPLIRDLFFFLSFAASKKNLRRVNCMLTEFEHNFIENVDMTKPIDDSLLNSLNLESFHHNTLECSKTLVNTKFNFSDSSLKNSDMDTISEEPSEVFDFEDSYSRETPSSEILENQKDFSIKKSNIKRGRKSKRRGKIQTPAYQEWTEREDELLRKLGVQYKNDWKKISRRILTLTGFKKTPAYLKNLFKDIKVDCEQKQTRFTEEEDLRLVSLIHKYGMKWVLISQEFEGRDAISLKNRYYSFIRKNGPSPQV